jgi:hypothetical protein
LASSKKPKHTLRLFLSVDVNDSTKLKASHHQQDQFPSWVAAFRSFYLDYPEELAKQCAKQDIEVPDLWKILGDELVFTAVVAKCDQVLRLLKAFRAATIAYQKPESIKLKNAAWLADFPVGNSEVMVKDQASKKPRLDFLGPHMDLGFRLTHKASVRRFVISAELALLILESVHELVIYFEGTEVLKGVLNDLEYPILWLDMTEATGLQDRLRGDAPPQHLLKAYCLEFIEKSAGQVCLPYLPEEKTFNVKPKDWDKRFEKACRLNDAGGESASRPKDGEGVTPKESELAQVVKTANESLSGGATPAEKTADEQG